MVLHATDSIGVNALYWAVVSDDAAIIDLLLNKYGLVTTLKTVENENNLLHTASSFAKNKALMTLLKCNIDPLEQTRYNYTAIEKLISSFILCYYKMRKKSSNIVVE